MQHESVYVSLEGEQRNKIYVDLLDVIFSGFENNDDPLEVLEKITVRGEELLDHPDWGCLRKITEIHQKSSIFDNQFDESLNWCRSKLSNGKGHVLGTFSYDHWLLIPTVSAEIPDNTKNIRDFEAGPHSEPPILRDLARVAVGWYEENEEWTYSEEEITDQERQGSLTRVVGVGDKHLEEIALFPMIIWSCGYFNRTVMNAIKMEADHEVVTMGGFHDGGFGFTGTYLGNRLCPGTSLVANQFGVALPRATNS